jgi:lysozyme-like protein
MGRRFHRYCRLRRYGAQQLTGRQVAAAVAGGAVIALAAHHGSAPAAGSGASGAAMSAADDGGSLSCSGLEALWESAGGSPGTAFMAAEIATAESGGRQHATDNDGNGTVDRGYWQVNSIHGTLSTYDPAGNARAAVQLSGDGTNWSPWVTYQTGAYQGQC